MFGYSVNCHRVFTATGKNEKDSAVFQTESLIVLKVLILKGLIITNAVSNKVLTLASGSYFIASSTATAQATVAPTIGLLPIPIRPIISTWAGTDEEPANWASECILPIVSVMP